MDEKKKSNWRGVHEKDLIGTAAFFYGIMTVSYKNGVDIGF